jgi:hypothetical protein
VAHVQNPPPGRLRTSFGIRRQLRLLAPLLSTWTVAAAVLAVAGTQRWTPLEQLFLDASYLGGQPWYSGILNEAGLISWAVAATAAGIGSWVAALDGRRGAAMFLGSGAVVVIAMLIDIWIQFHSAVAPRLGIPSNLAQAAIALSGLVWFLGSLREIIRTRWLILVASGAILGASAGIDMVIEPVGVLGLWFEDAARLVGILTLTHYLIVTTVDITRSVVADRTAAADDAVRDSARLSAAVHAALGTAPRDVSAAVLASLGTAPRDVPVGAPPGVPPPRRPTD